MAEPLVLLPGMMCDARLFGPQIAELSADTAVMVFIRQSRALQRRRDQQAVLRKCKVPSLILCGRHDELCPVKRHTFMAELIPYAELVVLEDAGHLPTLEQPAQTTQALRNWMKQPLVLQ